MWAETPNRTMKLAIDADWVQQPSAYVRPD